MTIIISKNGKNAQKIDKSSFKEEDYLQKYIYENPDSIPLYEIDENIRLLILAREFPTNSGPIDALGIDANGEIYLIETKLYKNPDKRLVVAQVLDYGAALTFNYRDFSDFLQTLETKVNQHFQTSLIQKINDFFGFADEEATGLIENLKTNLDKGRFRFVVLMDKLESRLKDLIIFLNQNSRFDVYGVELEYYNYNDFEIMIPRLFGAEVKKEMDVTTASGIRKQWNEKSFFEEIEKNLNDKEIEAIKKLYDFSKLIADRINWGTGAQRGSFNPILNKICPRSLFSVFTDGRMSFNYSWLSETDTQRKYRENYYQKLEQIFKLPEDLDYSKYPSVDISDWNSKLEEFQGIIEMLNE